jgi:uncharacterized membrane protein YfcA
MEPVVALAVGVVVGLSLGTLGAGGSVLTVPALAYLLGQSPPAATTGSLLVVGVTAAVGTLPHARAGHVAWRQGLVFGLLGAVGSFAGSRVATSVDPDLLLLLFALLMPGVAALMVGRQPRADRARPLPFVRPADAAGAAGGAGNAATAVHTRRSLDVGSATRLAAAATGVGLLTGFFGVGGGFVVVPALVLVLGMQMRTAVGTSLVVIAVNSATALAARFGSVTVDWSVVAPFAAAAVLASLVGARLAGRARPETLRRAFALVLAVLAVAMAAGSLLALI